MAFCGERCRRFDALGVFGSKCIDKYANVNSVVLLEKRSPIGGRTCFSQIVNLSPKSKSATPSRSVTVLDVISLALGNHILEFWCRPCVGTDIAWLKHDFVGICLECGASWYTEVKSAINVQFIEVQWVKSDRLFRFTLKLVGSDSQHMLFVFSMFSYC